MTFQKIRFILEAYGSEPLVYTCNQLIKIAQTERVFAAEIRTYIRWYVIGLMLEYLPIGYLIYFNFEWVYRVLQLEVVRQTISGPVPLPRKRRIYCVLRSPHVNKDSREHLEIRVHKRLIDIEFPLEETIERFKKLDILPGVGVQIKTFF
jgi:ribosomal protein S10